MDDAADRLAAPVPAQISVTGGEELQGIVGAELRPTRWLEIGREQLVRFDESTFHGPSTNYAGAESAAFAHGTQTLALLPPLFEQTVAIRGFSGVVLTGFDRVRFPVAVPVGGRVRARFSLDEVSEAPGGYRCRIEATVDLDGEPKPACVCEMVLRLLE